MVLQGSKASLENVTSKIKLNGRFMYDRSDSVPNCEIEQIFRHPSFYWIKSKQFDGKSMHFSNHITMMSVENFKKGMSTTLPIRYDIFMQLIDHEQI